MQPAVEPLMKDVKFERKKRMLKKLFFTAFTIVLLASCVALPVVEPVSEDVIKKYNQISFKKINLEVDPDDGSGYAPVYAKITKLHYKENDQIEFVRMLSDKIKEFGGLTNDSDQNAVKVKVKVKFISTFYESNSGAYTLNAELSVQANSINNSYSYIVSSAKEMSFGQMMSSSASGHKELANSLLLKKMIEDISLSLESI